MHEVCYFDMSSPRRRSSRRSPRGRGRSTNRDDGFGWNENYVSTEVMRGATSIRVLGGNSDECQKMFAGRFWQDVNAAAVGSMLNMRNKGGFKSERWSG